MAELDTFIEMQRSEHTKSAYRKDLTKWFSFLGERDATEEIALAWRESLVASLSGGSALRAFTTVRSYYTWLGAENPFKRIKSPRRTSNWTPVAPSDEDVENLLRVCTDARDRAIMVCLTNGLRAQEVCDLRRTDLWYESDYSTWMLRVTGKGEKQRIVPLGMADATAIWNVAGRQLMFPGLNPRKVHYVVEQWAKKAGIEGLHPHALRHGYATRLIRSQVDVFSVQRLLGHTRAETTSVYVNLDLQDLVNAVGRDPRNNTPTELREVV